MPFLLGNWILEERTQPRNICTSASEALCVYLLQALLSLLEKGSWVMYITSCKIASQMENSTNLYFFSQVGIALEETHWIKSQLLIFSDDSATRQAPDRHDLPRPAKQARKMQIPPVAKLLVS